MSEFRVFVGNVPFNCDEEEFNKMFNSMTDFMTATVIRRPNSTLSRGFGFVTFSSESGRNTLLNTKMEFGDRELRFSSYDETKKDEPKTYKLFLRDVTSTMTDDSFRNVGLSSLNKFSVMVDRKTNEKTNNAILSLNNYDEMVKLLKNKELLVDGSNVRVYPFRNKKMLAYNQNKFAQKY